MKRLMIILLIGAEVFGETIQLLSKGQGRARYPEDPGPGPSLMPCAPARMIDATRQTPRTGGVRQKPPQTRALGLCARRCR